MVYINSVMNICVFDDINMVKNIKLYFQSIYIGLPSDYLYEYLFHFIREEDVYILL